MGNTNITYKLEASETLKKMARQEKRSLILNALLQISISGAAYGLAYYWFGWKIIIILGLFEIAQYVSKR